MISSTLAAADGDAAVDGATDGATDGGATDTAALGALDAPLLEQATSTSASTLRNATTRDFMLEPPWEMGSRRTRIGSASVRWGVAYR